MSPCPRDRLERLDALLSACASFVNARGTPLIQSWIQYQRKYQRINAAGFRVGASVILRMNDSNQYHLLRGAGVAYHIIVFLRTKNNWGKAATVNDTHF